MSDPPVVSRRQTHRGWTKKVTVDTRKPVNVDRVKSLTVFTVSLGKIEFTGTARAILNHFKISAKHYDTLCYRLQHGERDVSKLKAPPPSLRTAKSFKGEHADYRGEGYAEHAVGSGSETGVDPEDGQVPDTGTKKPRPAASKGRP
jgi:hypothetical protein